LDKLRILIFKVISRKCLKNRSFATEMLASYKFYGRLCRQEWYHIPQVKFAKLSLKMQVRIQSKHNGRILPAVTSLPAQLLLTDVIGDYRVRYSTGGVSELGPVPEIILAQIYLPPSIPNPGTA
jgi:hypothetical protein